MNIENFIKRIPVYCHNRSRQSPEKPAPAKETPIQLQQYKTTHSIGTFNNSEPDEQAQLQFAHFPLQPQQQPCQKLKTLEDELNCIAKLKEMYESGCRTKSSNRKATQRSPRSRSFEKHCLKPSNTPSFQRVKDLSANKQLQLQRKESQNRLRKYYEQANQKSETRDAFTSMQETNSPSHEQSDEYDDSSPEFRSSSSSRQLLHYSTRLEQELNFKVIDLQHKTDKLAESELQNREYRQRLKQINKQNAEIREDTERLKLQKQGLETLLKQLLYEREREKILKEKSVTSNMKTDSRRQERKKSTPNKDSSTKYIPRANNKRNEQNCQNHCFDANRSVRLSTLRSQEKRANSSLMSSDEREDKKVKVQNILDKLKNKLSRY